MMETKQPIERLDLRVGLVKSVQVHPDADTMYIEQIDVGDAEGPRTIVSGLRNHVKVEDFEGKYVLVLCNLKPRKLRGIMSYGMILCASNDDHSIVELLTPTEPVLPGERVSIENYDLSQPDAVLNPKKKYWEQCEPDMTSRSDGGAPVACYKNIPLLAGSSVKGFIECKTLTKFNVG